MCEVISKIYEMWEDERNDSADPAETIAASDAWHDAACVVPEEGRDDLWLKTLNYARVVEQKAFESGFRMAFELAKELNDAV